MNKQKIVICPRAMECRAGSADTPPWEPRYEPGCAHRYPHERFKGGECCRGYDTCMRTRDGREMSCVDSHEEVPDAG